MILVDSRPCRERSACLDLPDNGDTFGGKMGAFTGALVRPDIGLRRFGGSETVWTNRRPRRRRGGWIRRHFGLGVLPGCSITGDLPGVGCRAAGRLWAGAVGVVGLAHALHGASVHETEDSESSKLVSIAVSFAFNLTFHHRKRG